ncbi:hypothetical protein CVT26_001201 [Gymnopilus dilepis]|uniref:Ribosome biogenesis protein NSA1 n=1 Tax=Gymnopilus dilepis TaxID=231916 RepID=A0A409YUL1_9AGAR|nr:hypothetical protein CVT26_001201 [Gymnopilus dilepis]
MSRFLLGDELGNIKALRYSPDSSESSKTVKNIYHPEGPSNAVQRLSTSSSSSETTKKLAAALANGTCFTSTLKDDDTLELKTEWKETRFVASDKFIGMSINKKSSVYTCTSGGMLRRTPISEATSEDPSSGSNSSAGLVPSRLCDWRLSESGETFAYGGDEVDLSVWDTERAFQPQEKGSTNDSTASSKKRKRNDLFPAEIWRARNLSNDGLNLRQPIRITALTYLSSGSSSGNDLMAGTQFGDIRRYDTRAARRPVSNWKGVGKVGGIKTLEKGLSEHELFVSDGGTSLSSIDLRTGGILYSYKGISGAVLSTAQSPNLLVSVAFDRYARVHSTVAPPKEPKANQDKRGDVLEKTYLTTIPTVVVWDKRLATQPAEEAPAEEDDDVWENMEHVS